ncbi:M48 family metallopeptidase [Clostridium sp. 'White wine YQ']|uniref:M48 family metallopeptidase n=1 Tax=Clostridium sp. 'White wine YQ' TaxID=3027474 RepID=UPI002366D69C|nr:M48 family metallopeptidase [Clostridium sp. 'White wine YQ']MDD7793233.1 M48 family metallopeptidase [Clostridium sp. 'White wine YQ']
MKKFLLRLLVLLSITFFITMAFTLFLESKYKGQFHSDKKVEIKIEKDKIIPPIETSLVKANYAFSKGYFLLNIALSIIFPIFIIKCGIIEIVENKFLKRNNYIREGIIIGVVYYLTSFIIFFPLTFFSSFYRLKLVGLLNYDFFSWLLDLFKNEALNFVLTTLSVTILYYIFKRFKLWPLLVVIFTGFSVILGTFIFPFVVDPLLNEITPMQNKELESKIKDLAHREGINNISVYQVKMSDQTSALNAYMTGIFSSKRIVVWDTTLNNLDESQILSVVAHEIGHYKLNHIPKGIALEFLLGALTYFPAYILAFIIAKRNNREIKGPYGLAYILLISTLIGMVLNPVSLYYSRKVELDADKFAIQITKDNLTNGILELKFMETNLSPYDVDEWYKLLRFDHPTAKERIDLANSYDK